MILTWPTAVLWAECIVSLPLYVLILITVLKAAKKNELYRTTFYNLMLSQGLADITAMISFFLVVSLKNTRLFDNFYWFHFDSYWVSAWSYNNVYYFLLVRCFGITLISLQRWVTICMSGSRLCQWSKSLSRPAVLIIHWLPPSLISLPIVLNTDIHFDSREKLNVVVQPDQITKSTIIANIFLLVTFTISSASYLAVVRLIFVGSDISKKMRRELRLHVQVIGLMIAFILTFIHYCAQFFFNLAENQAMIYTMRLYYPVLTGILSFVNPWSSIIMSGDLRRTMAKTIFGFNDGREVSSIVQTTSKVRSTGIRRTGISTQQ